MKRGWIWGLGFGVCEERMVERSMGFSVGRREKGEGRGGGDGWGWIG